MNRKMTVAAALVGAAALFFGVNAAATAHSLGKVVAGAKAKGPINQLVKAGTITQAEADAFTAANKPAAKTALTAAKAERDANLIVQETNVRAQRCGMWRFVNQDFDFTVQLVNEQPDFTIALVKNRGFKP
ncbi:MAG: hypothetical protein FJW76_06045 [Actinobacteria bacterium]|nr:hypothetical protein [Actinomycetota bacterium]